MIRIAVLATVLPAILAAAAAGSAAEEDRPSTMPSATSSAALAPRPIAITGTLIEDGKPLREAPLRLHPLESPYAEAARRLAGGERPVAARARTDAAGRFRLELAEPALVYLALPVDRWSFSHGLGPVVAERELGRLEVTASSAQRLSLAPGELALAPQPTFFTMDQDPTVVWTAAPEVAAAADGPTALALVAGGRGAVAAGRPGAAPRSCVPSGGRCTLASTPRREVALQMLRGTDPLPAVIAVDATSRWPYGASDELGRLAVPVPVGGRLDLDLLAPDGASVRLGLVDPGAAPKPPRVVELPLSSVTAVVLDAATRRPLAGVAVGSRNGHLGLTDPRGETRFAAVDEVAVVAVAPGYLAATGAVVEGRVAMALERGVAATVTVVDEKEQPVGAAEVVASPIPRQMPGRFRSVGPETRFTSETGTAAFAALDPGASWSLAITAPGYAPARAELGEPSVDRGPLAIRVTLAKGIVALARVVDAEDMPIPGAMVSLTITPTGGPGFFGGQPSKPVVSAFADQDGVVRLQGLGPGSYGLTAEASGFAPTKVPGVVIEAGLEEAPELGTVVLGPEAFVRVEVVDGEGNPVPAASVWAFEDPMQVMMMRFGGAVEIQPEITGADGRAVVGGFRAGTRVEAVVRAEGFGDGGGGVEAGAEPQRITLAPASSISGRVVDGDGSPVVDARITGMVMAASAIGSIGARSGSSIGEARSGEDGGFRFENVTPGLGRLQVAADGYRSTALDGLEVEAGQAIEEVEIRLEPGAALSGTVRAGSGQPLEAVSVWVEEGEAGGVARRFGSTTRAMTDAEGRFHIEGAPLGKRSLHAEAAGYRDGQLAVELAAGRNSVEMTLERGASVAGRVVGADGSPIVGAMVRPSSASPFARGSGVQSDADGRFRLEGLEPGEIDLTATAQGWASGKTATLQVQGELEGVEIVLERGARVVGQVLGVAFEDLGGVSVVAFSRTDLGMGARGQVDFEGRYALEGLGAGLWNLRAALPDGRVGEAQVELAVGQAEAQKDIEIGKGATLRGRVSVDGSPLGGAQISARGRGAGRSGSTAADAAGGFSIPGLEPDVYDVAVGQASGPVRADREVEVEDAGAELVVDIRTGGLRGRVVDGAGQPVVDANVSLQPVTTGGRNPLTWSFGTRRSDGGGEFRVAKVSAGRWTVGAGKEGFADGSAEVEIEPGSATEVEVVLKAAAGLDLIVRSSGDQDQVAAALLDASGAVLASRYLAVDSSGAARFGSAPAGRFELLLSGSRSPFAVATPVVVPSERPVEIALPPSEMVEVRIPALGEGRDRLEISAVDSHGHSARWLRGSTVLTGWPGAGGQSAFSLSPGVWRILATVHDGRRFVGTATVVGPGAVVELEQAP